MTKTLTNIANIANIANIISVEIKKPLYGNYIYLDSRIVEKAIRSRAKLQITIPAGVALVEPEIWKKHARVMKKVFKYPLSPMVLYGGQVPLPPKKGVVVEREEKQEKLF